ncbi:site-specific integrase [Mesorhizobium sp. LNJC391B00]|uniref:tyrosine-type recombinase/integrase n=1 Tax=Mesorhizobium sp. LNJC391B00 TaxID=1287273 RepID=UPI0003CE15EB|nr:site-specific integrase [Mesorhizobium sp. LNJC391B00]ESY31628.1 hypothetical protein X749_08715 [Mesorhizobium sp. LNJC391B00]
MVNDKLLTRNPRRRAAPKKVNLTEQRIADLKPQGSEIVVLDLRVSGLAVRVRASGTKTYVWSKKVAGRPVRLSLGRVSGLRLDDARKAAERLNGQVAAGENPRAHRAAAKAAAAMKAITLTDAFETFKASKQRRASTLSDYETVWRLHIPMALKSKPVADIVSADIEKIKQNLLVAEKSRTAGKVIVMLGAIMNRAGRSHDNPARRVERPESKVRTRRLSAVEIVAILKVLDQRRGDLFADLIAIALLTGARRGALSAMRWSDLDLDAGLWTVPATWSKNRRELAIALPRRAVEILLARQQKRSRSPWCWPSKKSSTGHIVNPEKPLTSIIKAAGVSKVSMHDLRRTLGSRLAMTGAGAATITAALGHVSPQSARAYVHLDIDPVRAAVEKAFSDAS